MTLLLQIPVTGSHFTQAVRKAVPHSTQNFAVG
jgi:hypothetical protein